MGVSAVVIGEKKYEKGEEKKWEILKKMKKEERKREHGK